MSASRPWQVVSFNRTTLYTALSNEFCSEPEVSQKKICQYLYRYLQDIGAQTLIVERDYTDGDYLDDYAAYYTKCFCSYDRRCKRLHFFSTSIDDDDFTRLVCEESDDHQKKFSQAYLGFVVARPLPSAVVGRTVLKTPEDDGRRHYTCTKDYSANLFGLSLQVRSLAYQEQDTVLAACATVALWCSFHKTRELFATASPAPATITRVGNEIVHRTRPIPSHGLNVQQICTAIRHVGLEPEVIEVNSDVPLRSLIYSHLRMGIPVILGVKIGEMGLHAITLTGYSCKQDASPKQEVTGSGKSLMMKGLSIDAFYAHDDQVGPFSSLIARKGDTSCPIVFESSWLDKKTGKALKVEPNVVIIPVYHKIRVTFMDVLEWLHRFTPIAKTVVGEGVEVEWDLYLTTTNEFKASIKKEMAGNQELINLLSRQHPRFIWRATMKANSVVLLEFLADATDMARSFPIYNVIWHHGPFCEALAQRLTSDALSKNLREILTLRFFNFLVDNTKFTE